MGVEQKAIIKNSKQIRPIIIPSYLIKNADLVLVLEEVEERIAYGGLVTTVVPDVSIAIGRLAVRYMILLLMTVIKSMGSG